MKRFIALLLVLSAAALACAAPTKADKALAAKYKAMDFTSSKKDYQGVQDGMKSYKTDDSTQILVSEDGSYMSIFTQDEVSLNIYLKDGKETGRSITLPSGRQCEVDEAGTLTWDLIKEAAPDFSLGVLGKSGKKVKLSDCRGKVVLLDFWASWCHPCMEGLPEKEALYKEYRDEGLLVYGINIEGDTALATTAAKSKGITFPVLMAEAGDTGEYNFDARQMKDYRITGVPAIFLIDREGIIQAGWADEQTIEGLLEE
jgi:thiol-disulfide isomerase/thioredoxin